MISIKKNNRLLSQTFNIWYDGITWKHLKKITTEKNGENVPHLEITKAVLVYCNIGNNYYQQDSRVLHAFIPNNTYIEA